MNRILPTLLTFSLLSFSTSLLHAQSTRPTTLPALTAAQANPTTPTSTIDLFNGKDFTGWVSYPSANPAPVWTIADGILSCTGKPNGYLRTETAYANYKLIVEWRFTRAGNTGVLVHLTGPDRMGPWPTCIECQGLHNHQGDFWIWHGAAVNEPMKQRNGVIMKTPSAEKPVGEWNTFQVVAKADTVTITVNGTEMNKVTGCNITSGQVALQCEGAALEVRKVTIGPIGE
jgi:hypothetical protein